MFFNFPFSEVLHEHYFSLLLRWCYKQSGRIKSARWSNFSDDRRRWFFAAVVIRYYTLWKVIPKHYSHLKCVCQSVGNFMKGNLEIWKYFVVDHEASSWPNVFQFWGLKLCRITNYVDQKHRLTDFEVLKPWNILSGFSWTPNSSMLSFSSEGKIVVRKEINLKKRKKSQLNFLVEHPRSFLLVTRTCRVSTKHRY